ncbi:LytTR family transcriptional regulator [Lactococcus piscium]|uniref:LytTR family DNA-binding domain-containing protein n=1 Tax=Pseudolactococcus carnosus TaxID=2749961 RepID=UPI001FBA7EE4|nr:LytTR family DNA-binding domain-containing protein [Lactococcus carnosus]MCJ1996383.1 LytTR family transcriptional regulator [Lactococcus carnosus]
MRDSVFTYQTRTKRVIKIAYSEIYFIEAGNLSHQLFLQTKSQTIAFYGSLTEIDKLSDCLLRIHRDTLVNQDKISAYLKKDKQVLLDDGTVLLVSRSGADILK